MSDAPHQPYPRELTGLVVAALLHGQRHDARGKPVANLRRARRNA